MAITNIAMTTPPRRAGGFLQALILVSCVLLGLFAPQAGAAEALVGVVYPEIREPYRSVFLAIVSGIEDRIGGPVPRLELAKDADASSLMRWANDRRIGVIIALGQRGHDTTRALRDGPPIVLGAVMMDPILAGEGVNGIVLNPDPALLFQRLKEWAPAVRQVNVVYNPEQSAWLIARARTAANEQGLILRAVSADSLQSGAEEYRRLVDEQMTGTDALWLLQDPTTLEGKGVFPHIMRQAWNRELVVFSSSLAHVKRGALFALYPDNEGLGRSLGAMALDRLQRANDAAEGMQPLRAVRNAVNRRTAEHLGIEITREREAEIDLAFPTR